MEFSDFDKKLSEYIDEKERNSETVFDTEDKESIWEDIQAKRNPKGFKSIPWIVAAASISLLLVAGLAFSHIRAKDKTIVSLKSDLAQIQLNNQQLERKILSLQGQLTVERRRVAKVDTIYQTKIVYLDMPTDPSPDETLEVNENAIVDWKDAIPLFADMEADGVESVKIEYGPNSLNGIRPLKFRINYN